MIIKIIGGALVITATTLLGLGKVQVLNNRKEIMENFKCALSILKNEIRFRVNPLGEASKIVAEGSYGIIKKLFLNLADELQKKDGRSVFDIWKEGLINQKIDKELNKYEFEIVSLFGEQLGGFDIEGETANIENTISRLDECLAKVNSEIDKNKRIYKNLGFLSGVLIVLLLF